MIEKEKLKILMRRALHCDYSPIFGGEKLHDKDILSQKTKDIIREAAEQQVQAEVESEVESLCPYNHFRVSSPMKFDYMLPGIYFFEGADEYPVTFPQNAVFTRQERGSVVAASAPTMIGGDIIEVLDIGSGTIEVRYLGSACAADEIESLRAENERLRKALKDAQTYMKTNNMGVSTVDKILKGETAWTYPA